MMYPRVLLVILAGLDLCLAQASVTIPAGPLGSSPPLPVLVGPQPPAPSYMVDNTLNQYGVAPDAGVLSGPLVQAVNASLKAVIGAGDSNTTSSLGSNPPVPQPIKRQGGSYWLEGVGSSGQMPLAPSGYKFFRNVKDYGAVGDGSTDDTAAINRAITDGNRCGADCGSTSTLGALVYFPAGTYLITTPIVQYFYTQFVGNANNRPTIQGSSNFSGIALIDTDFYIPGGNGAEWYINQNNFFRQIRNINLNMKGMSKSNHQGDQEYMPTGIHWQVAQGTSIQNVDIQMDVSDAEGPATAIGIFTENGSGGFMSDITITGGHYGLRIGSQQFTVRNIQFTSCLTAINHIWNWGFAWQQIYVLSCYVALNCTEHGGPTSQGTGSISVIDSHFNGVPYAITLSQQQPRPNVVIDNLLVENSDSIVLIDGGETILPGSSGAVYVDSWAMGRQYLTEDGNGEYRTGYLAQKPDKPAALLDPSGRFYVRSKPQYESVGTVVVATDHGISNAMSGDQTNAINSLLSSSIGSVIFFPAGIYLIGGTIKVPVGSVIVGEGWSQFMATGSYFQDLSNPKVLVQVGNSGDSGSVEISDMLFTTQGPTAGCIFMEWNIHQSGQGSAAMWDSHFRVGGAAGTDLQLADCPTGMSSPDGKCIAGSMMLHVTKDASGYFENVWAWVADHDLDDPGNGRATEGLDGVPQNVDTQVSIYNGRGILVESQGPTWLVGTSSEHSTLYQYQLSGAAQVYVGHMQTETPYYQPNPVAPKPFDAPQTTFSMDPTFSDCAEDYCQAAWALRVLNSSDVYIYSAGFYSFFKNNQLGCSDTQTCQEHILETNYVENMWLHNLFTRGTVELATPRGGPPPIFFNDSNQSGYTSEVALWLPLTGAGSGDIGSPLGGNGSSSGIVYIDPTIWTEPDPKIVQCYPPCTLILPNITLSTTTTITFPPYTTSLQVGWTTSATVTSGSSTYTTSFYTYITQSTVLTIPPVTTTEIPVWNVVINDTTTTTINPTSSILPPPFIITDDPNPLSQSSVSHSKQTRNITLPPFPYATSTTDSFFPTLTYHTGRPSPSCRSGCGHKCRIFCDHPCLICPPAGGIDIGGINFGDPNDPNYVGNPENDPDEQCTTSTYSSCRTSCITSPTSSCTSTCSPVVGCSTTGTDTTATVTGAPFYTASFEQWVGLNDDSDYDSVGLSIYSSFLSDGEYNLTSGSGPTTTGGGGGPTPTTTPGNGGGGTSPGITTIFVTKTFTTTIQTSTSIGELEVHACRRIMFPPRGGGGIPISDYNLVYIPAMSTNDVCAGREYQVYGVPTPKPSDWADVPSSVSFYSPLTYEGRDLTSCTFVSDMAGGSVACQGTAYGCSYYQNEGTFTCNPDEVFGGADTSILPLAGCPVSTATEEVVTSTTVQTITSSVGS